MSTASQCFCQLCVPELGTDTKEAQPKPQPEREQQPRVDTRSAFETSQAEMLRRMVWPHLRN